MRKLLIVSLFALVCVGGLAIYATTILGKFHERDQALRKVFEERAEDLRAVDGLLPWTPRATLDPTRFPVYLEVRGAVSEAYRERIAERQGGAFHARETSNDLLRLLRQELQEKKMSLAEYHATAARWRALLARPEFGELQAAWRATVTTSAHPDGLPLPEPAADASEKEREQLRRYRALLEQSMYADLLDPLVDEVVAGAGRKPGGEGK